jgi:hypothetical protein
VRGTLRTYADFLGLDSASLLARHRTEAGPGTSGSPAAAPVERVRPSGDDAAVLSGSGASSDAPTAPPTGSGGATQEPVGYGRMARNRDGPVKIGCDADDGCEVVK